MYPETRGSVVACGTMLQAGKSRVRISINSLRFFNLATYVGCITVGL
jgi:hypothetical protein